MNLLNSRTAVLVVEIEVEIAEMAARVAARAVDCLYAVFGSRRPNLAGGVERNWKENMLYCHHTENLAEALGIDSLSAGPLGRPRTPHQECLHYVLTWNGSP